VQKRSSGRKQARSSRRDREAAEGLTFLEKLVLRVLPTRQVPAESGVRFAIASKAKEDGICLVFKVDDADVPIVEDGPRPDYLVVHASREQCLFTIVEMKGREEKNVEHGIEQIRAMYRRLRQEMASCLPGSWRRAKIQAILLTPQNAHFNRTKIQDARDEGIEILPLQYHHQAELYPYVSKPISRTLKYVHDSDRRTPPELNAVERLIAEGKLDRRVRGSHFDARRGGADDTFFLDFRRPGDPETARVSLSANTRDAVLAFSDDAGPCRSEVVAHLARHALQCPAFHVTDAQA
jgi:hypothetical protein